MARIDRVFDDIIQRQHILFGAVWVWLLFVASFLMPVMADKSMIGWEAFWYYAKEVGDLRDYWRQIQREPLASLISTFPATNVAVFIAPVVLFCWPRWSGGLSAFLAVGGLVPPLIFFEMVIKNELHVGFYCWVISIFLMALLCLLDWTRQLRIRH
jgi:hypothetical protein